MVISTCAAVCGRQRRRCASCVIAGAGVSQARAIRSRASESPPAPLFAVGDGDGLVAACHRRDSERALVQYDEP